MEKLLFSFKTEGFQRPFIFSPKLKEIQKRGIQLSNLKSLCPFIKVVEVTNTSTDLAVYYGSMFYE